MKLQARVKQTGKNACGIEIPAKTVAALSTSRRPPVKATINGHTYRSSIAYMGGRFMLSVSADVRAAAGVSAGELVDLDLVLDTDARVVTVPPDFAKAITAEPTAKAAFMALSYSNQRRLLIPIEAIKSPENRERAITRTVERLKASHA